MAAARNERRSQLAGELACRFGRVMTGTYSAMWVACARLYSEPVTNHPLVAHHSPQRRRWPPGVRAGVAALACCALCVPGGVLARVQPESLLHAFQARPAAVRSQLVWLDRAGKRSGVLGILADYGNVELSPDGQRLAVAVLDSTRGTREIWMYDVASGRHTKLTSDPADENWLIWSGDGSRVVFNSQQI